MRPSWCGRVETALAAELARTQDVLVVGADDDVRVGGGVLGDDEVVAAARAVGRSALEPAWWRTTLGPLVELTDPRVHLFTDRMPELPVAPLVEQVAPWRLGRLRADAGEDAWQRSGLDREAIVWLGRLSEPLDPPAWMERASPAARRTVICAAASLTDWDGAPADVRVLTHPGYRRRGHGREVASTATAQAVREGGLARWCADVDDVAALALARGLGFERWATVLRVRLRR